jgi:outer membrane protein
MNRIPLLALALLGFGASLSAQPGERPISLDEAIRLAEEHNPQYRRALTEVGTAEADLRRARGAFLPTLDFAIGARGSYSRVFTGEGQFGEPVTRDDPLERRGSSTSQSLSLGRITLFDGGQRMRELRAAEAGRDATDARVAAEVLRVRGEVTRRYWEAARSEQLIRLEEELLVSARERLEVTTALVRVGVRGPLDVLGAEVAVAEQEQALERARGEARKAELELRQAIGLFDGGRLRTSTEPPTPGDPSGVDASALVERALSAHPRVARAEYGQLQSEHRFRSARAGRLPRLGMSVDAGRNQSFNDFRGLAEPNPLNQALGVGFNLSFPLFTGYQTSYQIQAARAGQDAAREEVRAERLAVERDVRAALVDVENAFRADLTAHRTLGLNQQRLELAQQQYRVGALTMNDLTDAAERAARAERDALRARYDYAVALGALEERVGATIRP